MTDDLSQIPEQFESYISFIMYYDMYQSNYFDFVKELSGKHKSILKILESKRVSLDDAQFLRFTQLLDLKLKDVIDLDFNEINSFNNWSKVYQFGEKRSSLKLRDVLYISEGSQLDCDLNMVIDDNIIAYEGGICQLQSDFIKIATKVSIKEIVEYCYELFKAESIIKEIKLSEKYNCKSIALYHFYSNQPIDTNNREKIAVAYGYKNGSRLYYNYNRFRIKSHRVSSGSKSYNTWKNKYFEQAKEILQQKNYLDQLDGINKDFEQFKKNIEEDLYL